MDRGRAGGSENPGIETEVDRCPFNWQRKAPPEDAPCTLAWSPSPSSLSVGYRASQSVNLSQLWKYYRTIATNCLRGNPPGLPRNNDAQWFGHPPRHTQGAHTTTPSPRTLYWPPSSTPPLAAAPLRLSGSPWRPLVLPPSGALLQAPACARAPGHGGRGTRRRAPRGTHARPRGTRRGGSRRRGRACSSSGSRHGCGHGPRPRIPGALRRRAVLRGARPGAGEPPGAEGAGRRRCAPTRRAQPVARRAEPPPPATAPPRPAPPAAPPGRTARYSPLRVPAAGGGARTLAARAGPTRSACGRFPPDPGSRAEEEEDADLPEREESWLLAEREESQEAQFPGLRRAVQVRRDAARGTPRRRSPAALGGRGAGDGDPGRSGARGGWFRAAGGPRGAAGCVRGERGRCGQWTRIGALRCTGVVPGAPRSSRAAEPGKSGSPRRQSEA